MLTPASPKNCQELPLGATCVGFAARAGCSKLPSLMAQPVLIAASSMKAVLSAAGRSHAEELNGIGSGRDGEIRRLIKQVIGARRRDQADLRAVDQDLDFLVLGLIIGALGGQERDVVRAGVKVDGLAHAAVVLEEGDLAPVGGIGAAQGEAAAIGAHAGLSRELPAGTAGRDW